MTRLERLLRPRSIAVIGGGFFGTNVVSQCRSLGYDGDVWPVHPTREEVAGVKAFRTLADLPAAPDAAFIGVNRRLTLDMVRELAACGAGGAVCFASGFGEAGEEGLQGDLVAAAGAMPVIGPNCYGLLNYADGVALWPDQHGGARLAEGARGSAVLTQSSNIAINLTMQRRGLPLAYVVTAGNQAQTGLSEIALGLIEDDRVSVLGLHIEAFDSVAGFERLAARARELQKSVVALKAGRSDQARAAAISHTASLAGSDSAADAFLRRLGIARVHSLPALLEALKLFHVTGPLAGVRLSSMSCSGGEAALMADAASGRSVRFPALEADHAARVAATLGPLVAIANPLDYHTFIWNDGKAMEDTFSAMVSGGFDLNLLVLDVPRGDRCSAADWGPALDAFEAALKANGASGAVIGSLPENLPEETCLDLIARGIAPLCGIAEAIDAAEAAAMVGEAWQRPPPSPLWGGSARSAGVGEGRNALRIPPRSAVLIDPPHKGECEARTLDEAAAKTILAQNGLPVPAGRSAQTPDEVVMAAREIGFPVALKALGIAHKSELQAVRLKLRDEAAVRAAAAELSALGTGLFLERMVEGGVAELIVGVTRDPAFGPVMTIGTGGVLVELLKDTQTLLLPATREEIEEALRGLKLFPLLDGYRGRPKADLAAAIDAVLGIAEFALAHADSLDELDINPLILCERGAWIADALMVSVPAPPSVAFGDISPTRGEINPVAAASPVIEAEQVETQKLPTSPLVGEMAGRPEGGAKDTCPSNDNPRRPQ